MNKKNENENSYENVFFIDDMKAAFVAPALDTHKVKPEMYTMPSETKDAKKSSNIFIKAKYPKDKGEIEMQDIYFEKDIFLSSLKINIANHEHTYIYVVAATKGGHENNKKLTFRCHSAKPLGGYAYDVNNDSCYVEGLEILPLGHINIACNITMEKTGSWLAKAPLPESIVEKNLSLDQKKSLKTFMDKYSNEKYSINYIQLSGCN